MIIGVDMDEVLAQFLNGFLNYHNPKYGTSFNVEDFHTYDMEDVIGVPLEELLKRLDDFHTTDYFYNLKPVDGSIDGIGDLSSHELHILTARPSSLENETNKWIKNHFPSNFKSVNLLNYFGDGKKVTKGEMCDRLGIDLMIEDNYNYARDCAKSGRLVALLERPWNSGKYCPSEIVRVRNWDGIVDFVSNVPLEKYS